MKLSKIIILFSLFMLGDLLSAMEFRVIDFYEDTYNRYNNSYSKQQLIERSESLFIIKINFSEPFHIQAIDDIKKMNRFPDTYIGQVKTNADSLVITKKNYEECIFRFPSNIEKGKQYVVEIESIEAYYLNIDFHPSNGATYLNGNKYIYGQSTLPGKYHLTHFHDGYKPKEDSIEVNQKTHYFSYDLVPEEKKQIRITTYPDSATVFQNNKEIGITPLTINFDSHKNKFEIRKKMFRPIIESISDNENIEKEYRLEPVNFKISITPPDARIILIDEFDKTVNFFQYKQTHFADLKAGKYKLIISKNGFRKYKDEILLNSENKYDNQINLKESFWSKIHNKKNIVVEGGDFIVAREDIFLIGIGGRTNSHGVDFLIDY
ncbi:MAG: hypothetical protein U9N34_07625, partial [Candidatus Cloacimonadota bacterium]|nr:hypothetical protein [Candidatus Cloacimonadota bacterium]